MSDAFRNVEIPNLGTIGEDAKNRIQAEYDRNLKKFSTEKELEGGIGTLKAMVSGKKLGEAIEERVKPIIKRKVGEEFRAFKDRWTGKAKEGIDRVLKPKVSSEAVEDTQTEGNLSADLGNVSQKAQDAQEQAELVRNKLNKIRSKGNESRAVSKEAQADRLEEELNETERLAKEAGFKNATTDQDIPLAVRQQTKVKYQKMGKLRDEAKQLRRQNQSIANEEQQVNLSESKPVSSQENSTIENSNVDDTQSLQAKALGKAQLKSESPNNTPKPKGKGKGEEEVGEDEEEATVGDDVGEGVLEALGGALDDTGILAPIGLLLGAVGIGLGADKKGKPPQITDRSNENDYSYQAGIN